MPKILNLDTNFDFVHCPFCKDYGLLWPFQIKKNKRTILMCDECDSTWFTDDVITTENWLDLESYIRNLYPEIIFGNDQEIYSYIEELNHETILEDIDPFDTFPKESSHFFTYQSNAFYIFECNMNEDSLIELLIKSNSAPVSIINPHILESHTRIIRYNFRFFCDVASPDDVSSDIIQFSHITTRGLNQFFRRKFGTQFQHLVYDISEKKMYYYHIRGRKGNPFFDKAVILHNMFYPEHKIE
jgi:hypothetical protein